MRTTTPEPDRFPLRAAGIDVGSNAMRILVGEFAGRSSWTRLAEQRVPVRLGASVFGPGDGALTPEIMEAAVSALTRFRERMDRLGVQHYRAATTSAVREAANGSEFVQLVLHTAGIRLEPINAAEEARLVWQAVAGKLDVTARRWMLVDLGGGSVEVALADGNAVVRSDSFDIGAVRMLAVFRGSTGSPLTFRRLAEEHIDRLLSPAGMEVSGSGGLVATGGNIEELARLGDARRKGGVARLSVAVLGDVIDQLAGMTPAERSARYGLRADRADVVLPAALVYERIAQIADADELIVPGVGLKEGLLLDAAASAIP